MSISVYKLKKWYNMLAGKSVHHVNQDEGKMYSKESVEGYYNNLTEKILRFGRSDNRYPLTYVDTGEEIEFSIAIFQYGLAAYDLYLYSGKSDNDCLAKVKSCADWAVDNQLEDGAWVTFEYENPEYPYSSMAQGEGISLLIRAYIAIEEDKYIIAARKAKEFMLLPIDKGGTTLYEGESVYFYECPREPLILNGWIFSIWGLYDYWKFTKDSTSKDVLDMTLDTLERDLPSYDLGYWSKYEDKKRIASPFYHKLHIAQLRVMYDLTGRDIYKIYANRWNDFSNNWVYSKIAFIRKAIQKVFE